VRGVDYRNEARYRPWKPLVVETPNGNAAYRPRCSSQGQVPTGTTAGKPTGKVRTPRLTESDAVEVNVK
jgi:hypothetical protein